MVRREASETDEWDVTLDKTRNGSTPKYDHDEPQGRHGNPDTYVWCVLCYIINEYLYTLSSSLKTQPKSSYF